MGVKKYAPANLGGAAAKPGTAARSAPDEPALRWDRRLSLGVAEIDDQHQALIGYCNDLVKAVRRGQGQKAVAKLMTQLRDYTVRHFTAEEGLMERMGYPELDAHRAVHNQLTKQVKLYQRQLYQQHAPEPAEVRSFLKDWLIGHILGEDLKIAAFLKSR